MNEKIISLELANLAAEKKINFYSVNSYYEVFEDTYHESSHNGNKYLAYKKGEIICKSAAPADTNCKRLANAYSQHDLQTFLREKHKIHITIHYLDDVYGYYSICTALANNMEFSDSGSCKIYEDALEMGLKAAVESLGRSKQFVGPKITTKEFDNYEMLPDKPYFVATPMREINDRLNLIKNQMKILGQGNNPTYVYALSCQYSLLVELRDLNKKINL